MARSITRPTFGRLVAAAAAMLGAAAPAQAATRMHRVAFHVDRNDAAVMNLALNNATNVATYYSGIGEQAAIELVAYGPGLHMLRDDTSPVKDRIASVKTSLPEMLFSACDVTKKAMEKSEGHVLAIVPQARVVPSGAVRLIELQEQGSTYIKP